MPASQNLDHNLRFSIMQFFDADHCECQVPPDVNREPWNATILNLPTVNHALLGEGCCGFVPEFQSPFIRPFPFPASEGASHFEGSWSSTSLKPVSSLQLLENFTDLPAAGSLDVCLSACVPLSC